MSELTIEEFVTKIVTALEIHAEALAELYANQERMAEGFQKLSQMNDRLMQALLRHDEMVPIQ